MAQKQLSFQYCNEDKDNINTESTLLDFLLSFLFKAVFSNNTESVQPEIKNEVTCDAQFLSFNILRNALSDIEVRRNLFKNGTESAVNFLSNLENSVQELS